jgi:hypothetical protein
VPLPRAACEGRTCAAFVCELERRTFPRGPMRSHGCS